MKSEWVRRWFLPQVVGLAWLCVCGPVQRATCGTWVPLRWSLWRVTRRFRRPPRRPSPRFRPRRPPWSTSKCRRRASRSPTTRGSKCSTAESSSPHWWDAGAEPDWLTACVSPCRLFFRRHYAVNTVIFCSLDPQGRKWVALNCPSHCHWTRMLSCPDPDHTAVDMQTLICFEKFQQTMCISEVISVAKL